MIIRRIIIIFGFLFALLWLANNLKKSASRIPLEAFNKPVIVKVVELPLCGRSNIIVVSYQDQTYRISINKNDCIQGKYIIGDTLDAIYNPKLDEMNPGNFVGTYRLNMIFIFLVGIAFLVYIYILNAYAKGNKR
ncbi:MAG: hypothetical protein WAT37_17350 [Saprospiraceae bacterium]